MFRFGFIKFTFGKYFKTHSLSSDKAMLLASFLKLGYFFLFTKKIPT